jgi:hypothetical protein
MNYKLNVIKFNLRKVEKMKYEFDVTKLSYESKRVLAFDKNTPSDMLDALADDEEVVVRMNVTSNSNTSAKTLMWKVWM